MTNLITQIKKDALLEENIILGKLAKEFSKDISKNNPNSKDK